MKLKSSILLIATGLLMAVPALAAGPCKDKFMAKHTAHKDLQMCIRTWIKDLKPTDTDPSDDCSAKLSSFVQSAKDLKACRSEHAKK